MSFMGLPALVVAAVGAIAAGAVLLLYLLRSIPRPQPVSNVDFWLKAAEAAKPSWLFSTRIPVFAMLLTLLVALLTVLLAGDPSADSGLEGTTVVVLDAGRSMGARHGGGRRIDRAVELLEQLVGRATVTGEVAVIRAGVRPSVLVPLTSSPRELGRALERTRPMIDDGDSDLDAAVRLAAGLAARFDEPRRIVVVSDRRPEADGVPFELVSVGDAGETLAIVTFGARRDPVALGEYLVLCEVEAFTRHPARARLIIRDLDVVVFEEDIELEPGERVTYTASGSTRLEGELSARLEDVQVEGTRDALAADDVAFATVPPLSSTRVLLVTQGNRYLETALGLDPTVELEQVTPAELAARRFDAASFRQFQVVVYDRCLPDQLLPHPGVMMIDPPADPGDLRFGRVLEQPRLTSMATDHPVLESVDLGGTALERGRVLLAGPEDRVLVRSERHALSLARETPGERRIVLGFDPAASDLVRRPAFPLLMHNAVVWLAHDQAPPHSSSMPGTILTLPAGVVTAPGGEDREVRAGIYSSTDTAGIYEVNRHPRAISAVELAGPIDAAPVQPARRGPSGLPPLAFFVGLLLLAVMTTEWVLLHRGRI
jgi:hypothetical protein